MAADPVTDELWMAHEYASETTDRWGTWIGAVAFDGTTATTTSSTTSTTGGPVTTTTTTVPAGVCETPMEIPSFTSIGCDLRQLLVRVDAEIEDGPWQARAVRPLLRASISVENARRYCDAGRPKRAKRYLRTAARGLKRFSRRVMTEAARVRLDREERQELRHRAMVSRSDALRLGRITDCSDHPGAR
jgi:hypothetical protein